MFQTPNDGNFFFGYYTNKQFSSDNAKILSHRINGDATVTIGYFDLASCDDFIDIIRTNAWNYQQGSQLQWKGNDSIVFNRFNENGVLEAVQVGLDGVILDIFNPIYHTSEFYYSSLDYRRHSVLRGGYSYKFNDVESQEYYSNEDRIDIYDWNHSVVSSIKAHTVQNLIKGIQITQVKYNSFEHPQFNIHGDKLAFLYRLKLVDGDIRTYLFSYSIEDDKLDLWSLNTTRITHYNWTEADEIVAWCGANTKANTLNSLLTYTPRLKNLLRKIYKVVIRSNSELGNTTVSHAFTGDSYKLFNLNEGLQFRWSTPNLDGHPTYIGKSGFLITDTYPDLEGRQLLMVVNRDNEIVYTLSLKSDKEIARSPMRCDFHPRVTHDETHICIDISEPNGKRGMIVLKKIK